MAARTRSTPKKDWKPAFLKEVARTGNILLTCELVGIGRRTFYTHRDSDQEFASAASEALEIATERLEEEARRRAFDGLVRKKFDKGGKPILDPETGEQYVEREYSDTLLIFLLKAHNPKKYREAVKHEVSGPEGGPIPLKVTEIVVRTREEAASVLSRLPETA